jgi:tRNA-dihydrouridine synthase
MNFTWDSLPKPFFALAPMEDVTDTVFRRIVAGLAPPDIYFTEFTNAEGMFSRGDKIVSQRLRYTEEERPIIAQIWGTEPKYFHQAALRLVAMGFDGIDINLGCPERSIIKQGACAALIKNPALAAEIITATKKGIAESGKNLPLSVKTRIGFNEIKTEEWIGFLLSQDLDAIAIHGRTAKEQSAFPAHWDEIGKAVVLRNQLKVKTLIIGNGDVKDRAEGLEKVKNFHVEGIMIGRGVFHNLWAFAPNPVAEKSLPEMLELLIHHARLYTQVWGKEKPFVVLRKFFKIYVQGFTGASKLREELMQTKSLEDVEKIVAKTLLDKQG